MSQDDSTPIPTDQRFQSIGEFASALLGSQTMASLESTLNGFNLSTENLRAEDASLLKSALGTIVEKRLDITNKILRRRMSRMMFAISSPEEQTIIKNTVKVPKPPQPKKVSARRSDSISLVIPLAAVATPKVASSKTCLQWADEVNTASAATIENVLQNLATDNLEPVNRDILLEALNALLLNTELVSNAKMRRRVSRLLQVVAAVPENTDANVEEVNVPLETVASTSQSLSTVGEIVAKEVWPVGKCLKAAIAVSGGDELESVLARIPWNCNITNDCDVAISDFEDFDGSTTTARRQLFVDLKVLLVSYQDKASITSNARIRRRVKRIIEMIDSKLLSSGASNDGGVTSNAVDDGIGLKRPVDTDNGGLAKKRKLSADVPARELESSGSSTEDASNPTAAVPQVLFFGQLSFDTTAADIEAFLRENSITGPVSVRVMTDAKTKQSRGAAFVEFSNIADENSCLSLHHAKLKGRRINVERTCGGRNSEVRAMKIKHIREEQKIALSEKVDGILKRYEKLGAFNMREINDKLMNRLYALTPELVTEILEEFHQFKKRYTKTPVTLGMLHKLVSARDEGGVAVDQSKGLKFGSKFDQPKKRKLSDV